MDKITYTIIIDHENGIVELKRTGNRTPLFKCFSADAAAIIEALESGAELMKEEADGYRKRYEIAA